MKLGMNKLVILCGTQRCGSTMIVSDFRATGVLGMPEEYFIPWTSQTIEHPIENYKSILKRSSTPNGVSSIKVMANQLEHIEESLSKSPQLELSEEELSYMFPHVRKIFASAKFIRVHRLGLIPQAVSRVMSRYTGKNHLISESSSYVPGNNTFTNHNYNDGVHYDKKELDQEVFSIAKESSLWDLIFDNWDIAKQVHHITYESCIDSFDYLNGIGEFLGENLDSSLPTERKIKKIGNDKNREFIHKYTQSFMTEDSSACLPDNDINMLRDTALRIEKENTKDALLLMQLAAKLRPLGGFIKNKVSEYQDILKKS